MRHSVGVMMVAAALAGGVAAPPPASAQSLGDAITGIATGLLQQEVDRAAFAEAQAANTVQAYRTYIQRFPRGLHRADADRAIERLGGGSGQTAAQADRAAFAQAQRLNTTASYRDYLARYPDGIFRADAELALSQLNGARPNVPNVPPAPSVVTPAAIEADLGLTRSQRTQIQRQLTQLGHDTRGADGVWGRNTRTAISGWQRVNNLGVSGYVTAAQVRLIAAQAAQVSPSVPSTPTTPPAPTAPPVTQVEAERAEKALGLSIAERREVQLRLTLLGHDTKGTDGDFGQATRDAIRAWQRSQSDRITGYLTEAQIRALQRQTRG